MGEELAVGIQPGERDPLLEGEPKLNHRTRYRWAYLAAFVGLFIMFFGLFFLYPIFSGKRLGPNKGGMEKESFYLTIWNGWVQMAYWGVCSADAFLMYRPLNQVRHFFFGTIAYPIATFVGFGFYALIHDFGNSATEAVFANLAHGLPFILIQQEVYILKHEYPKEPRHKLLHSLITFFFCLAYLSWNLIVHAVWGEWVYPFESKLSNWQIGVAFPCLVLAGWSLYFVGERITYYVHSNK